jgi:hypothetical protein
MRGFTGTPVPPVEFPQAASGSVRMVGAIGFEPMTSTV